MDKRGHNIENKKLWLVCVTFPKSIEVFRRRKNGVKLMQRNGRGGVGQARKTVAAARVMGVQALPRYHKATSQEFGF